MWCTVMMRSIILLSVISFVSGSFSVPDKDLCGICRVVVKDLEAAVNNDQLHSAVMGKLGAVCGLIGPERTDACNAVIDGLTREVLYHLLQSTTPSEVCVAMTACSAKSDVRAPSRVQEVPRKTAVKAREVVEQKAGVSNMTCELCEFVIKTLDSVIDNKTSRPQINATVYQICQDLPQPAKDTCLTFAPMIVDMFVGGVDPLGACTNMGECVFQSQPSREETMMKQPSATGLCELCELLVQAVDTFLKDNATEAEINATIYNICNDMPGPLKDTCLQEAPKIVATLANGTDPQTACTQIRLCPSNSKAVDNTAAFKQPSATGLCELCELLVQAVDTFLKDNATEAEINATIYNICNDMPGPLKDTCLQEAPKIVATLANGTDPQTACTQIRLCPSKTRRQNNRLQPTLRDDEKCTICKDHVQILDDDIYRKEDAVQSLLEDICHRLPPPTDQACLTFADTNFPEIFTSFLNGTGSAASVCKLLGACSS